MTSIQFTVVVEGAGMPKQMPGLTAAARAGLVALAFIVAAPASGAADPKARYGDTMVIGITGDPARSTARRAPTSSRRSLRATCSAC
jgi:hypothetical protein